jgi:hypothetical protein
MPAIGGSISPIGPKFYASLDCNRAGHAFVAMLHSMHDIIADRLVGSEPLGRSSFGCLSARIRFGRQQSGYFD